MKSKIKIARTIISLFLILLTTFSFASCNILHKHVWQDHLVKSPSCTEVGILKSLCIECGKSEYSEISMTEHNYANGICTACGVSADSAKKALTAVQMPTNADNQGMWSFSKIHEKTCSTLNADVSYSSFMYSLSGASLKNASFNVIGMLRLTVTYPLNNGSVFETPVILTVDKVSPINSDSPIGVLLRADIENNELFLTYTTGNKVSAGKIIGNNETTISGFGINSKNELIIYYSNNTIAFGGLFAS